MNLDFKRYFNAALLPGAVAIVLWALSQAISPFLPDLISPIVSAIFFISVFGTFVWAGMRSAKSQQQDLVGGALAGAIAAAIYIMGTFILLTMILVVFGMEIMGIELKGISPTVAYLAMVLGLIIGAAITIPGGAFGGAIGAYFESNKGKPAAKASRP